jgi:hypothetical protein
MFSVSGNTPYKIPFKLAQAIENRDALAKVCFPSTSCAQRIVLE